jgi:3-oxoacyl-[acyl-carrier protein] reductase
MNLEELRIMVTGAARGIGRHLALQLCRAGAKVLAVDLDGQGLKTLAEEVATFGGVLRTSITDVAREPEVVAAVERGSSDFGSLNGAINCAGIYRDGLLVSSEGDGEAIRFPLAQWQRVIDVDLTGTFLVTREVAAQMLERKVKPGIIINFSSISRRGNVGQSNYSAAKAGVVADTRLWAHELAPHDIRVAVIAPGLIQTPILKGMPPDVLEGYVSRVPLRRLGRVEEIFAGVRFIIECDYFTGRCVDIDGGFDFN